MSNTQTNPQRYPKCPHCNAEPCRFSFILDQIGPMRIVEFYCIACMGILSISIVEIAQPQPPLIMRPV